VYAGDFNAWRSAVKNQFPDENVVIRSHETHVRFQRQKNGQAPISVSNISILFQNLTEESQLETIRIALDGQTSLEHVRIGRRKIRVSNIKIEPYSDGALLHRDIRIAEIPVPIKGSYREVKLNYRLKVHDVRYQSPLYLPKQFALYNSLVQVVIPEWLKLNIKSFNMADSMKFAIEEVVDSRNTRLFISKATSFEPVRSVSNILGPSHVYPHLIFIPQSYLNKEERWQPLFRNLSDLYNWYHRLLPQEQPDELTITDEDLLAILNNPMDDKSKAVGITDWVRGQIRYLAYEGGSAGYAPELSSRVMENRYGDCKGMSNLLKDLLLNAGIDARLGWLGTDYLVYDYSDPVLSADNHMICVAMINEDTLYLDATDRWYSGADYSNSIAGREVLISNGDDHILSKVPEIAYQQHGIDVFLDLDLSLNALLAGTGTIRLRGECKADLARLVYEDGEPTTVIADISGINYQNVQVDWSDVKTSLIDGKPMISFNVLATKVSQALGSDIYVDLSRLIDLDLPVIEDRRKFHYSLGHGLEKSVSINVKLPEGYRMKEPVINESFESDQLEVKLNIRQLNSVLKVNYDVKIKVDLLQPHQFKAWNEIILQMKDVLGATIILKKD